MASLLIMKEFLYHCHQKLFVNLVSYFKGHFCLLSYIIIWVPKADKIQNIQPSWFPSYFSIPHQKREHHTRQSINHLHKISLTGSIAKLMLSNRLPQQLVPHPELFCIHDNDTGFSTQPNGFQTACNREKKDECTIYIYTLWIQNAVSWMNVELPEEKKKQQQHKKESNHLSTLTALIA